MVQQRKNGRDKPTINSIAEWWKSTYYFSKGEKTFHLLKRSFFYTDYMVSIFNTSIFRTRFQFFEVPWTRTGRSYFIDRPMKGPPKTFSDYIFVFISIFTSLFLVFFPIFAWFLSWLYVAFFLAIGGFLCLVPLHLAVPFFFLISFYIVLYVTSFLEHSFIAGFLNGITIIRGERGANGLANPISEGLKLLFYKGDEWDEESFSKFDDLCAKTFLWVAKMHYEKAYSFKTAFLAWGLGLYMVIEIFVRISFKFFHFLYIVLWFSFWGIFFYKVDCNFYFFMSEMIFLAYFHLFVFISRIVRVLGNLFKNAALASFRSKFSIFSSDLYIPDDFNTEGFLLNFFEGMHQQYSSGQRDKTYKSFRIKFKETRLNLALSFFTYIKDLGWVVDNQAALSDKIKPKSLKAVFTTSLIHISKTLNDVNIPGSIRTYLDRNFSVSIEETVEILKECGYPVMDNLEFTEPNMEPVKPEYEDFVYSGSSAIFGLPKMRVFEQKEFNHFKDKFLVYKRSDEYVDIYNELDSLSRYFVKRETNIQNFEKALDDTWEIVKEVYKNSRVTPIHAIYKAWNKSYNVGPFAASKTRGLNKLGFPKKMKRREDIARFPKLSDYLKYWENLAINFPRMRTISTAFYKSEALPEKKWSVKKLRTPISTMLPQYIWQAMFSASPNHIFKPFITPSKVGLPLTGFWLSKVFERHLDFENHFAGDMKEFDSTITGQVLEMIGHIRKRGFENHKQHALICQMIDLNYKAIHESLLMTPSTGNIYKKSSGLTTGHYSTSADTSLVTTFLYLAAWRELTGLSAHEFKKHGQLDCYGDDHIYSWSSSAPSAWTPKNITKVLAKWGITMKDECPTVPIYKGGKLVGERKREYHELEPLPFLSKFCRKPTAEDRLEWLRVFGTEPPKLIVFHNPDALLGKMKCGVTTRNPETRIERLLSYMDLTAHNKRAYLVAKEAIHLISKQYPKTNYLLSRIPTYERVLEKWYSSTTSIREPDGDQIEEEGVVTYGQMTILDYIFNYFSVVPDVLNPSLQRTGFGRFAQKVLAPLLRWPRELLTRQNNIASGPHCLAVMKQTSYDFLDVAEVQGPSTNLLTLLVRHWLFELLRSTSSRFDPFQYVEWLQHKIANAQYILNAKVQVKYDSFTAPVYNLLLVSILNFLHLPDFGIEFPESDASVSVGSLISEITFPDLGLWLTTFVGFLKAKIWLQVPPNFKSLAFLSEPRYKGHSVLIRAGTGTGKSTTMILYFQEHLGHLFKKIIVLEPRSEIVKKIVPYVKTIGVEASGCTTGLTLDEREKVFYMTPQELILRPKLIDRDNLYVVDEAHLDELAHRKVLTFLVENEYTTYLATASPDQQIVDMVDFDVDIHLPQLFKVVRYDHPMGTSNIPKPLPTHQIMNDYLGEVVKLINTTNLKEKYLIFVWDKKDVENFTKMLPGKFRPVSSSHDFDVNEDCNGFVTTSVSEVALTFPGVTTVITTNLHRIVEANESGVKTPSLLQLSELQHLQRKGRTGRTNNGTYHVFNYAPNGENAKSLQERSKMQDLADWMSSGLDLRILAQMDPNSFSEVKPNITDIEIENYISFIEKIRIDIHKKDVDLRREIQAEMPNYFQQQGISLAGTTGVGSGFELILDDIQGLEIQTLDLAKRAQGFEWDSLAKLEQKTRKKEISSNVSRAGNTTYTVPGHEGRIEEDASFIALREDARLAQNVALEMAYELENKTTEVLEEQTVDEEAPPKNLGGFDFGF